MPTRTLALRSAALVAAAGLILAGCSDKGGTAAPVPTSSVNSPSVTASTSSPELPTTEVSSPEETTEVETPPVDTTESSETTAQDTADSTSANPTSFPEMTVDTGSADSLAVTEKINKALLTPTEVGKGFTETTYTPSDPTDTTATLPCGQVSTAVMFPNALRTGTTLTKGNTAQLEQAVNMFLDSKTAAEAYDYAVAGLSCSEGDVGGTKVAITDGGDVSADVGAERAQAWTATIGKDQAVLVAVNDGDLSLGFTFVLAGGADSSTLPNPLELVAKAVKKLQDAGL